MSSNPASPPNGSRKSTPIVARQSDPRPGHSPPYSRNINAESARAAPSGSDARGYFKNNAEGDPSRFRGLETGRPRVSHPPSQGKQRIVNDATARDAYETMAKYGSTPNGRRLGDDFHSSALPERRVAHPNKPAPARPQITTPTPQRGTRIVTDTMYLDAVRTMKENEPKLKRQKWWKFWGRGRP